MQRNVNVAFLWCVSTVCLHMHLTIHVWFAVQSALLMHSVAVHHSWFMIVCLFLFLILSCSSPSCRRGASTATPLSSLRRWSSNRVPFTRRRRDWPRTDLETTARIHSLWVTSSYCYIKGPWNISSNQFVTKHDKSLIMRLIEFFGFIVYL